MEGKSVRCFIYHIASLAYNVIKDIQAVTISLCALIRWFLFFSPFFSSFYFHGKILQRTAWKYRNISATELMIRSHDFLLYLFPPIFQELPVQFIFLYPTCVLLLYDFSVPLLLHKWPAFCESEWLHCCYPWLSIFNNRRELDYGYGLSSLWRYTRRCTVPSLWAAFQRLRNSLAWYLVPWLDRYEFEASPCPGLNILCEILHKRRSVCEPSFFSFICLLFFKTIFQDVIKVGGICAVSSSLTSFSDKYYKFPVASKLADYQNNVLWSWISVSHR